MEKKIKSRLIAPCGMDCALCLGYLRDKKRCPGCRDIGMDYMISCVRCIIRNCDVLKNNGLKYCSGKCDKYPCKRLKNLDERYRTKYGMSMIRNLENIGKKGIKKFIKQEEKKWIKGDKIFCVHRKKYFKLPKV